MTQQPLSILLVEDDDVAAESVIRNLHKFGVNFPIIVAEDGMMGLEILRGQHIRKIQRPLVVLLDLNMPRMNGFEFLQELRADETIQDLVVFVLTTSDSDSDRSRAYHQNIAGYIVKSAVGPQFSRLAHLLSEFHGAVRLQ